MCTLLLGPITFEHFPAGGDHAILPWAGVVLLRTGVTLSGASIIWWSMICPGQASLAPRHPCRLNP